MRICSKCKKEKEESEFYVDKAQKRGFCSQCKKCQYECKKEYLKKYQKSDKRKMYVKEYRKSDKCKMYQKEYQKEYQKKYQKSDKGRIYKLKYQKEKIASDVQFRLAYRLRIRLWCVLDGKTKNGSAVRDLGCSISFLKKYLEERFQPGMSWENWGIGRGKWHIDHKYPLSKVDLTDREQLLKVCHYTNLQPLWAEENIRKGNKILDF